MLFGVHYMEDDVQLNSFHLHLCPIQAVELTNNRLAMWRQLEVFALQYLFYPSIAMGAMNNRLDFRMNCSHRVSLTNHRKRERKRTICDDVMLL